MYIIDHFNSKAMSRFNLFYLVLIFIFLFSCADKNELALLDVTANKQVAEKDTIGLELLKSKCYACHAVNTKSHDEIIAPPLAAVKRRYLMMYPEKKEFVQAISQWAKDPKEEKAIMKGAVTKFKVMPYQHFDEADLVKIASYMYDEELEVPAWFPEHEKQMHGGNGKGKGRMNGMQ